MKKKILNSALIAIAGVGLLAGAILASPVTEPTTMLFFGTGLIGAAGIIKKEND